MERTTTREFRAPGSGASGLPALFLALANCITICLSFLLGESRGHVSTHQSLTENNPLSASASHAMATRRTGAEETCSAEGSSPGTGAIPFCQCCLKVTACFRAPCGAVWARGRQAPLGSPVGWWVECEHKVLKSTERPPSRTETHRHLPRMGSRWGPADGTRRAGRTCLSEATRRPTAPCKRRLPDHTARRVKALGLRGG